MQFVILGAGALGILLSAHLARAGHPVQLIARGVRARELAEKGLTVKGLVEFGARCEILMDPTAPTQAEVDRKSTRLNSSHTVLSRMPSSA